MYCICKIYQKKKKIVCSLDECFFFVLFFLFDEKLNRFFVVVAA